MRTTQDQRLALGEPIQIKPEQWKVPATVLAETEIPAARRPDGSERPAHTLASGERVYLLVNTDDGATVLPHAAQEPLVLEVGEHRLPGRWIEEGPDHA